MIKVNPVRGFFRTIVLYLTGNIIFVPASIGKEFEMNDGLRFKVFRHVVIRKNNSQSNPQAVFRVRFQLENMTVEENKTFSRIPMLIFMGFHGFRSKYWMVNEETGLFQGIYEWDTMEDAERYSQSIALRFMTKRSVEGTIHYEIEPWTENHV